MEIRVEFTEEGLFGPADTDGYDIDETERQFSHDVEVALLKEFGPDTVVTFPTPTPFDRVRAYINGILDHESTVIAEHVVGKVWQRFDYIHEPID